MGGLRVVILALAFFLEVGALVALGYWGFRAGDTALSKALLGIGAPLLAAVVWGLFVAPKAVRPVPLPVRLALKALVFGGAALGLMAAGRPALGWAFLAAVLLNETALLVLVGDHAAVRRQR
jgi:hypothetical protein